MFYSKRVTKSQRHSQITDFQHERFNFKCDFHLNEEKIVLKGSYIPPAFPVSLVKQGKVHNSNVKINGLEMGKFPDCQWIGLSLNLYLKHLL